MNIHLQISGLNLAISTAVLMLIGVVSGLVPAMKAARLVPAESRRYE